MTAMTIRQLTPPESEPVTLEQAKGFVRVDTDADDALLSLLITAARQEAEAITGRALGESTEQYGFVPSGVELREPIRAVFTPGPDFPQGKTVLTVRAGYPAERFPEPIRQWMLVRIGTLYEQRESFAVGSNFNEFGRSFVDCLLDPYVVAGGF